MDEYKFSIKEAELLLQNEDDQLYTELARNHVEIAKESDDVSEEIERISEKIDDQTMLSRKDVTEFGRRVFKEYNKKAYELVCGTDKENDGDRKKLLGVLSEGKGTVTAVLAGIFVSSLGWSPALAGVIAALVVKVFFKPTYQVFCDMWFEKL